jgi:group I intron endonuclease
MQQAVGYVYAIENTVNNRCYIGSATDYKSRWHTHRSSLRRGKHHSFILQRAWDKYGEDAFAFKVLVICTKEQRIEYENLLMPLQSYNVLRTAKEQLVRGGWKHTDAFRQKMSAIHKGKKLTNEHRKKLSDAAVGRKYDQAFREKARHRQLGVSPSQETRDKLSLKTKERHKTKVENNYKIAQLVHAAISSGSKIRCACKQFGISDGTFYKYAKLLSLPLLGHKNKKCAS